MPSSVTRLEWKLGSTVTDARLLPFGMEMLMVADKPVPETFIVKVTLPFLSVLSTMLDALPSSVMPPTPFGPPPP